MNINLLFLNFKTLIFKLIILLVFLNFSISYGQTLVSSYPFDLTNLSGMSSSNTSWTSCQESNGTCGNNDVAGVANATDSRQLCTMGGAMTDLIGDFFLVLDMDGLSSTDCGATNLDGATFYVELPSIPAGNNGDIEFRMDARMGSIAPNTYTFTITVDKGDGNGFSTLETFTNGTGPIHTLSNSSKTNVTYSLGTGLAGNTITIGLTWTGATSAGEGMAVDEFELWHTPSINPLITLDNIDGTSLFGTACANFVAGTIDSFTVSGADLTNDVILTPPSDYEISLNQSTWVSSSSSITLTQSGGNIVNEPVTIYLRLVENKASGTFTQNLTATCAGANDKTMLMTTEVLNVSLSGFTSSSADLCIETTSLPSSRLLTGSPSGGTFSITGGTGSGTITDNLLKATSAGTIEITYTFFSTTCGGGSVTQTITAISDCQEPIIANPCETGGISLGNAIDTALANLTTENQTILLGSNYYTNKADGGNWGLTTIALPDNLDGLTIDGQGMWVFYDAAGLGIFDLSGSRNVTFKNFTIEGVNRSNSGFNLTDVKNLTFENVNFVNSPSTQPMVISANGTDTTEVTFNNCTFSGNPTGSSIGSCGANTGSVLIQSGATPFQPIITTFNNCTFRCNCRDGNGGAVQIISSADLPNRTLIATTFNNCEFANNFTSAVGTVGGGAIYAQEQQTLNINNCNFYNNEVQASITGGGGGAISIFSKVDVNVFESIFSNNSSTGASSDGGAISATSGGASSINNISIISSEFNNNSAADEGGAVWYRNTNTSIINSTFISNTSGKEGAGIQIENATGTSTFNNLTITTHASNHGIFSNSAPYTLNNTRFFNNASDLGGTAPSGSGNTNAAPNAIAANISSNTDCPSEKATPPLVNNSLPEPCASFDSGVALPIELLYFTVKTNQQCKAEIEWKTATEINNNYFKLLKSNDGFNFKEIAKVNGKGNSTEISKYTYIDNENNQNQVYYQLAQVDFDGTTEYFKIIAYKNNCNNTISSIEIKPNPFYDFIHIDIANIQTGNIAIEILNIEGKIIYKNQKW